MESPGCSNSPWYINEQYRNLAMWQKNPKFVSFDRNQQQEKNVKSLFIPSSCIIFHHGVWNTFMFFFLVKRNVQSISSLISANIQDSMRGKTLTELSLWCRLYTFYTDICTVHTYTVKTFVKEILKGFLNLPFKRFFRRNPWKRVVAVIWTGVWQKHGWLFPYIKVYCCPYLFSANVLARRILIIFSSFLPYPTPIS